MLSLRVYLSFMVLSAPLNALGILKLATFYILHNIGDLSAII